MRKLTALLLALCMLLGAASALADEIGERRVTIGADLNEGQRYAIYSDFGIEPGEVREIIVTNQDERRYLGGLVPDGKIGSVALSCIYIEVQQPGAGLSITTKNINWCTGDMYRNALTTAGVKDAQVMVSAPYPVSGTAALTGAYKAYEDITGVTLDELAKSVGVEELIITGELAEYIGSDEATQIVTELKKILAETKNMTDDEVRTEIRRIAKAYSTEVTDAQVEDLLKLVRKLETLDLDVLRQNLLGASDTIQNVQKAGNFFSSIAEGVKSFFAAIGNFFTRLFGGGK